MEHPKKKKRRKEKDKGHGQGSLNMTDALKSDEVPSPGATKIKISLKSKK